MPLKKVTNKETLSYNIKKEMDKGKTKDQAIAIAMNTWFASRKVKTKGGK